MAWIRRLRALFRKEELDRDFEEELRFHLSMRERRNVEQGMPHGEARRSARLRFGNPAVWLEQMREIDLMTFPQTVMQDLRFACRMLVRNAGFTAIAVFALAVGIGLNTAAFTAYQAFFERKLDAHDPASMVNLALIEHTGATDIYRSATPIMRLTGTMFIRSAGLLPRASPSTLLSQCPAALLSSAMMEAAR